MLYKINYALIPIVYGGCGLALLYNMMTFMEPIIGKKIDLGIHINYAYLLSELFFAAGLTTFYIGGKIVLKILKSKVND